MKILLVEDDKRLGDSLTTGIKEEGFFVKLVRDGYQARDIIAQEDWEIFIFDVMLPGLSGIQLCEYVRFKGIKTPILMLSALGEPEDKIKALDIGADDYLVKPFHFNELISRLKALKRRSDEYQHVDRGIIVCADLEFDYLKNQVKRGDTMIELSQKEFKLLHYLLENKGNVVSRINILQQVWQIHQDTYTNIIDVYISYLRSKIDSGFEQKLIRTIKGRGYMITDIP